MNLLWVMSKSVRCTPEQIWQEGFSLLPRMYHRITSTYLCFMDVSVVASAPFLVASKSSWCSASWCVTICISKLSSISVTRCFVPLLFRKCLRFCGCTCSVCAEVIPNKIRCSQGWFLRHVFCFQAGIFLFSITWGCLLLSQLLFRFPVPLPICLNR